MKGKEKKRNRARKIAWSDIEFLREIVNDVIESKGTLSNLGSESYSQQVIPKCEATTHPIQLGKQHSSVTSAY